jgi:Tfp pilus assembly protein PilN
MIEINLLPQSMRRRRRGPGLRKELLLPVGIVGGIIIIILAVTLLQRMTLNSLDRKMKMVEEERQQYANELEEIKRLESLRGELQTRMQTVTRLDGRRKIWVEILEDLDSRLPDYVWLSLVEEAVPKKKANEAEMEPGLPEAVIRGYAFTLSGLATFIDLLKGSSFLKEPTLSYFKLEEREGARGVYVFEVKCSLPLLTGEVAATGG